MSRELIELMVEWMAYAAAGVVGYCIGWSGAMRYIAKQKQKRVRHAAKVSHWARDAWNGEEF